MSFAFYLPILLRANSRELRDMRNIGVTRVSFTVRANFSRLQFLRFARKSARLTICLDVFQLPRKSRLSRPTDEEEEEEAAGKRIYIYLPARGILINQSPVIAIRIKVSEIN